MPYKVWATGEEALAADFNPYLQEQVIATFANAAARDAGILTPRNGQFAYLVDRGILSKYDGTAWRDQAVETWYGFAAPNTTLATAGPGTACPGVAITGLPAGDYLVRAEGSFLVPVNIGSQIIYQIYRNTTATLLGGPADIRPFTSTGASAIGAYSLSAFSKADAGGTVTFGIAAYATAGSCTLRSITATVQRVRAMN